MKSNIANPNSSCKKKLEILDDQKLRDFFDKRLAEEVREDASGEGVQRFMGWCEGSLKKQGASSLKVKGTTAQKKD